MCEVRDKWQDTPSAELVYKDMNQPNGEEWPYGDRRQELVFIGHGLKHGVIQGILDQCLLNDEEMARGPDGWETSMAAENKIQLSLDDSSDEEEEDIEEEEDAGEDGVEGEEEELSEETAPRFKFTPNYTKKYKITLPFDEEDDGEEGEEDNEEGNNLTGEKQVKEESEAIPVKKRKII